MSRKHYQIISISLPCLFFIPYLLFEYGENLEFLYKIPAIVLSFHYLKPILALLTFFSGIYFLKAKIKPTKNEVGPRSLIFLGLLFILLSFVPSILAYSLTQNLMTESNSSQQRTDDFIVNLKKVVLDANRDADSRKEFSSTIYIWSGELVEYLHEDGQKTVYSPTNSDKEKRQKELETKSEIKAKQIFIKHNFIYHLAALGILSILFLVILKIKPPESEPYATQS